MNYDTDPTPPHGIERPANICDADICDECGQTSSEPMAELDHGHSISNYCADCARDDLDRLMDRIAENHADDEPRRTRSALSGGFWL